MRKRYVWPSAFACVLLTAVAASAQEQGSTFRVDVKLVHILASVRSKSGELVGGLNKEDFQVAEEGVPQEPALFERRTEQPLSFALMVDTSSSTGIKLRQELESVRRFLGTLFGSGNPQDVVALYTFNDVVTMESSFTNRMARLEKSLKGLKPDGGTSLYDAIVFASHELEHREGRKVLLVVTDGDDTTSVRNFHDALESIQLADGVFYAILIVPIQNDPGRNIGGENALIQFSSGTGGRTFRATLGDALDGAFSQVLLELRTQYYLAYYPKNVPPTKNRFHRIEVRVRNPDLRVLARTGYYGESKGSARER